MTLGCVPRCGCLPGLQLDKRSSSPEGFPWPNFPYGLLCKVTAFPYCDWQKLGAGRVFDWQSFDLAEALLGLESDSKLKLQSGRKSP